MANKLTGRKFGRLGWPISQQIQLYNLRRYVFFLFVGLIVVRPVSAQPVIFWVSEPVGPNETMMVAGANLGEAKFYISHIPDGLAGNKPDDPVNRIELLQPNSESFKAFIPSGIEEGVYRFRLETPVGKAFGFINAPDIYWFQGDGGRVAQAGGWIRVMGRNIIRAKGATLQLRGLSGNVEYNLQPSNRSLWDAKFLVPPNIRVGQYHLRLWNGQGSDETVADVGNIDLRQRVASQKTPIDVKLRGAKGDGRADDTAAFQRTLLELGEAGGGQLSIPRGIYILSDTINIPENVAIVGAGAPLSVLTLTDMDNPPTVLLKGTRHFEIKDLSIEATRHGHLIEGGFAADGSGMPDADILLEGLRIRSNIFRGQLSSEDFRKRLDLAEKRLPPRGAEALRLAGGNVRVINSDIQASMSALLLKDARDAYIAGNRFSNGRDGWYVIGNSDRVIFENNVVVSGDLNGGGGGIGTHWGPERAISQNILMSSNDFRDLTGGDGEAITTDGPGGCYTGPIVAVAGSRTVTIPNMSETDAKALTNCRNAGGLAIISGRGAGETAVIAGLSEGTIQLTKPMRISSDDATVAVVVPVFRHILVVGNRATDAGVAVQFYGSSWENIMVDNVSERTGGLNVQGRPYNDRHPQPAFFTQMLGNRIQSGITDRRPPHHVVDAVLEARAIPVPGVPGPILRGVIMRGNHLEGNASILLRGDNRGAAEPGLKDAIVEKNTIHNVDIGINIFWGTRGVILDNNVMTNVRRFQSGNSLP